MYFSSPLFLIGLVAVAVPVVVHLFNFRRYKKVYFSNVDRLEQIQSETRRQSTLRQLLILATRILAILFLVLAFARPVISHDDAKVRTGTNDVSIFIDNSFSMENSDGNGMLLDKAKNKAREIVSAYGPGDRFQLLTCDIEGRHFHWFSKEEMLSLIDEVQISGNSAMIDAVANRQAEFLHGGRGENRYAYLISDFQSSAVDMEAMPADSSVDFTLVPLASASCDNVYIDSVSINAPSVQRGNSVAVSVWLCNDGDENLDKVPVSLFVNNRQRALATVDLPARSSSTVDLPFVVDETGTLDCRVETEDYPITFDNIFYFSLNVRNDVDCLLVEGKDRNPFLYSLFDSDSAMRYSSMMLKQMDFSNLEEHNMIVLDELPSISSGMAQSLFSFVSEGGTVVIVVADDADETSYNSALSLFSAPLLAGKHNGRVTAATLNMQSPLYLNVFNGKNSDIELPTVNGYHRLQPSATALREPVITLAGGDDFICRTPCGNGNLYIISAPLRDANTDFVRQALFVPTLYNMALYSLRPSLLAATLGGEQSIPLISRNNIEEHTVRLIKADDDNTEIIPDIRLNSGTCRLVMHNIQVDAGNYHLTHDGTTQEGISLNYPRVESKMEFLGTDALQSLTKDFVLDNVDIVPNADKPLDSYFRERMQGSKLWRWCLIACLLMILVEIILIRNPKFHK